MLFALKHESLPCLTPQAQCRLWCIYFLFLPSNKYSRFLCASEIFNIKCYLMSEHFLDPFLLWDCRSEIPFISISGSRHILFQEGREKIWFNFGAFVSRAPWKARRKGERRESTELRGWWTKRKNYNLIFSRFVSEASEGKIKNIFNAWVQLLQVGLAISLNVIKF